MKLYVNERFPRQAFLPLIVLLTLALDFAGQALADAPILVPQYADPGWVPLFPAAKGLIIERGLLPHSAIVAREMGIPTILGLPDLLSRVASGEVVEMNGATGVVRLHVGES